MSMNEAVTKSLPINDPMERRAICLKLAIETKGVAFSLKNDASVAFASAVIEAARMYENFLMEGSA